MIAIMRNTIKNHLDFKTDRECPYSANDLFSVHTKPAKFADDPRYGLVVSKRNFRFAVQRNRVKRLLRDWIRFADEYMCADLDYVFFARVPILDKEVTREIGRDAMVRALESIKNQNDKRQK